MKPRHLAPIIMMFFPVLGAVAYVCVLVAWVIRRLRTAS